MTVQFAKVKYSLYNTDSFQADSDEDNNSETSSSNLNSNYLSRKVRFCKETKIQEEKPLFSKTFQELGPVAALPTITLQQVQ